jgi:4-hydroxy-3-methylbut-2-enyl diphosphate reductase
MQNKKNLIIKKPDFVIEISENSGFCFGVVNAINEAEKRLKDNEELFCVGSIVHNKQEVMRLEQKGLRIIDHSKLKETKNKKILFRAHGEPPESYKLVKESEHELIDATCPVVLRLQQRVKEAYLSGLKDGNQIVIFGKKNHAEVIGLLGQTEYNAIVVESINDIHKIDLTKPIDLFSQTTKPLNLYNDIAEYIKKNAKNRVNINDTVCRQVSNRQEQLTDFSKRFDVVFFIGDPESSNSKLLYSMCKKANKNSFFVTKTDDIENSMFLDKNKIGVCGATSSPAWLMEEIAYHIDNIKDNNNK